MSNNELNINCPHCGEAFELTEALAAPLLQKERDRVDAEVTRRLNTEIVAVQKKARAEGEAAAAAQVKAAEAQAAETAKKLKEAQTKELEVRKEREKLQQERAAMDLEVQRRVDAEKLRAAAEGKAQAGKEWEAKVKALQADVSAKDAKLLSAEQAEVKARELQKQAEDAIHQTELTVARRLQEERSRVATATRAEAAREWESKLKQANADLAAKDAKLRKAEDAELQARKLKQEADEALRQVELTVARKLDEERAKVRADALQERDAEFRLKLGDKDKQLESMRVQIEELRRKGDSGSQQLVGDVLELDLQEVLSRAFPTDAFERVRRGQGGADLLQIVRTPSGIPSGRILWESKRTKNWSDTWLAKLREDQRSAKADVAALVSETLPDGVHHFESIEGVWVSCIALVVPMAVLLRHGLTETRRARVAAEGADTKKDLVYAYLTGSEFNQRVRGMIEPLVELRDGLSKEKSAITRQWSAREKQMERIGLTMAGMYGDLHGVIGNSLPAVEGLSVEELGEASNTVALIGSKAA
jgi:hypothetical protein